MNAMGEWMAFVAALAATGVLAGLIAGLLGVGGGIVIVPVLFQILLLLGYDPAVVMHVAVGTSLMCIVPTSIASLRAHAKRDSVDVGLLKSWAPAVFAGSALGSVLAGYARGDILSGMFALLAFTVAAQMAFLRPDFRLSDQLPRGLTKIGIGGFIGGFSSMIGIGGGTLSVPVLTYCNYPMRLAVGTASAIGLVIAVPGALGFMAMGWGVEGRPPGSIGYVSLVGFALIAPLSFLAAPYGARIAHAIPPVWLKRAFAIFLVATGAKFLASIL